MLLAMFLVSIGAVGPIHGALAGPPGAPAAGGPGSVRSDTPPGPPPGTRPGTLPGRLARALAQGDRATLARLGAAAGARGLMPALEHRGQRHGALDHTVTRAAVLAAPAAEDGWALLLPLARHAAGPDRPLAVDAARAAARIAARLARDWEVVYAAHDIPDAALARDLQAWRAIGADAGRWAEVRIHALEVSTHLAAARARAGAGAVAPYHLEALAADADAQVRRAAFELLSLPLSPGARATAARAVVADADPAVALAAAQALCSGLALATDTDARAAPILAALGETGLERLRLLVPDPALPPAARIDGARCLAVEGTPASRRAVQALQSSLPARIRGQVRRLVPGRR